MWAIERPSAPEPCALLAISRVTEPVCAPRDSRRSLETDVKSVTSRDTSSKTAQVADSSESPWETAQRGRSPVPCPRLPPLGTHPVGTGERRQIQQRPRKEGSDEEEPSGEQPIVIEGRDEPKWGVIGEERKEKTLQETRTFPAGPCKRKERKGDAYTHLGARPKTPRKSGTVTSGPQLVSVEIIPREPEQPQPELIQSSEEGDYAKLEEIKKAV